MHGHVTHAQVVTKERLNVRTCDTHTTRTRRQVVTKERPDLEEEKSFLIKQQNEFKIKLKELEAGLLRQARPPRRDTPGGADASPRCETLFILASRRHHAVRRHSRRPPPRHRRPAACA